MDPEEEALENMTTDEAVELLMVQLPQPVQDFLVGAERAVIVRELAEKYHLHIDQAGKFERSLLFMLLGASTPEEFVSSLSQSGLSQEAVNGLVTDVNTRIFIPLREKERASTGSTKVPQPQKAPVLPPPSIEYQPAPPRRTLPGSSEPVPSVPATTVHEPTPVPTQPVINSVPNAPQQGWHPAAAVHIYVPAHSSPPQPIPAPVTEAVLPPVHEPVFVQQTAPEPKPTPALEATPSKPIVKEYPSDPYREPIQ